MFLLTQRELKEHGSLTEYQFQMLIDMSGKVPESIAEKYDKVREGVKGTMVGGIIETRASKIYHEGLRRGEKRGEKRGENRGIAIGETRGESRGELRKSKRTAIRLHAMGDNPARIADVLEVNISQVKEWLKDKPVK